MTLSEYADESVCRVECHRPDLRFRDAIVAALADRQRIAIVERIPFALSRYEGVDPVPNSFVCCPDSADVVLVPICHCVDPYVSRPRACNLVSSWSTRVFRLLIVAIARSRLPDVSHAPAAVPVPPAGAAATVAVSAVGLTTAVAP